MALTVGPFAMTPGIAGRPTDYSGVPGINREARPFPKSRKVAILIMKVHQYISTAPTELSRRLGHDYIRWENILNALFRCFSTVEFLGFVTLGSNPPSRMFVLINMLSLNEQKSEDLTKYLRSWSCGSPPN